MNPPTVELIFFDAGGGHRAAAEALRCAIEERGATWNVRLLHLQELLDRIDPVKRLFGLRLQDVYNHLLRREITLGIDHLLKVFQFAVRLRQRRIVALLEEHWRSNPPDLVVSLIPHFNRAVFESLQRLESPPRMMTVLTDPADYPPHFWIENQDQLVVCGTEKACRQAREIGLAVEQISQVSGMIVHPRFYGHKPGDRDEGRRLLGLEPNRATGLVSFGGQGSKTMLAIARQVEEQVRQRGVDVQMIFICGHNEKLRRQLAAMPTSYPKRVEGFTREMPRFMALADFFVGKPGPGSISEALLMGLPVALKGFGGILPQERYNLEWVREEGVGLVVERAGELGATLSRILEPTSLAELRSRVARQRNRAVFEVVDLLARQLGEEIVEEEGRQVA